MAFPSGLAEPTYISETDVRSGVFESTEESDEPMSLTSWILDRITSRRGKRRSDSDLLRKQEVQLYLRRLEDRRVLSVTAIEDAYFVDEMDLSFSTSPQAGVLSNDVHSAGGPLFAQGGTFATAQGGTVSLNADGSFDYFSPFAPGTIFVDQFTYAASDGTSSSPTTVKLFVGEVPIDFTQPTMIPVFSVETLSPDDVVQVNLDSPRGSLTLLDTTNISFDSGANGGGEFIISGTARDINKALDQLKYTPPSFYSGVDEVVFDYKVIQGSPGGGTEIVPLVSTTATRTLFAVDDAYFVDPSLSSFSVSGEADLLANDFSTEEESFFFMVTDSVTTKLGGTVDVNFSGSFTYTPPNLPGSFVDSFVYTISNEIDFTSAIATLYVGEVPVQEDVSERLPIFSVEPLTPFDAATVELTSARGASLTLLNTAGIVFEAGANGQGSFKISGNVLAVNAALDSLVYTSPFNYSGPDTLTFWYEIFSEQEQQLLRGGTLGIQGAIQDVPIKVEPIADPPLLFVAPNPVQYSTGQFAPVDIDVLLTDVDGSEIPGFIILSSVPAGVVPNVGQPAAGNPGTFLILPSELAGLSFLVDAGAPQNFTIVVTATSIETTNVRGAFGGPGGPLLPSSPSEPRFAFTSQTLSFVRLTAPAPPPESIFPFGPLSPPPGPPRHPGPKPFAGVVAVNQLPQNNNPVTTIIVFADGPSPINNDSAPLEEQKNEQDARAFDRAGIYVRKIGGEGPGQFARLPEELSDNYSRFMEFLRKLPNGDYVVYFKRGGQSHEQAAARQVVVKVRVVNHRLNPDPGEFKPAGEVAEPPKDPNMHPVATENPETDESADALDWVQPNDVDVSLIPGDEGIENDKDETPPISAAAWVAAVAGWKFRIHRQSRTARVDRRMERFSKRRHRLHAH